MSDTPLLSFIVRSLNYERYLGVNMASILGQTVQDFEVAVVNEASPDGSCNSTLSQAQKRNCVRS